MFLFIIEKKIFCPIRSIQSNTWLCSVAYHLGRLQHAWYVANFPIFSACLSFLRLPPPSLLPSHSCETWKQCKVFQGQPGECPDKTIPRPLPTTDTLPSALPGVSCLCLCISRKAKVLLLLLLQTDTSPSNHQLQATCLPYHSYDGLIQHSSLRKTGQNTKFSHVHGVDYVGYALGLSFGKDLCTPSVRQGRRWSCCTCLIWPDKQQVSCPTFIISLCPSSRCF